MFTLIKSITHTGLGPHLPGEHNKYVVLTNTVSFVALVSLTLQLPIFILYLPDTMFFLVVTAVWIVTFPVVFWLNYLHKHLAAKVYTCIMPMLFMGIYSFYLAGDGNVHYLYTMLVIAAFSFFLDNERRYLFAIVFLYIALFIFFEVRANFVEPLIKLPEGFLRQNHTLILITLIVTVTGFMYFIQKILREAERNLALEKNKSDRLLRNTLPDQIADELIATGNVAPVHYESATVLFTDFIGFTHIATEMAPAKLIDELDFCFSKFDSITSGYRMEKLKTIGDAYMAVAGIPQPNNTHAIDAVLAAIALRDFITEQQAGKKSSRELYWDIRIGIHTGPLVAGVIGEKKFAYDVWGDTVNTAARHESAGEKNRINISESTYRLVEHFFECESRGPIDAKGKGRLPMFFVNGLKAGFRDENGGPNRDFWQAYQEWPENASSGS